MTKGSWLRSKNRIEALSDGIYAIAVTLPVLTLDIGELPSIASESGFVNALLSFTPQVLHYLIAFFILVIFWMVNHKQLDLMTHVDSVFSWLTMIGLFFVAMIPFTTGLVGIYGQYPEANAIFAANLMMIGLFITASWTYATGEHRLIKKDYPEIHIRYGIYRSLIIPSISALIIVCSMIFGMVHLSWLYLLSPLGKVLLNNDMKKRHHDFVPDRDT